MQEFTLTLLICSITMSMLALFYILVTPLLAKRYSVKSRYYAWLIIVIGLIVPFRPQFRDAVIKVNMPSNTVVPIIQFGNGIPVTAPIENSFTSASSHLSWWQIALWIWLTGMIIFLAYHTIKHSQFLKLAARWSENITDEQTLALVQTIKTQMGVSNHIGIKICDSIGSPMMIGFVNPCILLPKADFTKDELRFILKHELVHYMRKDLWYKCLVLFATAIHWFNPVVYLMAKAIDIQCELSCDEEVVRDTGADTRQYYIETIIGVVRYQSKQKTALSTNFYGGKKGMKKRIFSIMDMHKKKSGFIVLCGVLMLTLGTGFAFAAKVEAQNPPESIKEDIMISAGFLPNPAIYAKYLPYGIEISDDGKMLQYNGQRVRLFADDGAFFLDEAGALDLTVTRNSAVNITGIERISEQKAQEYRSAFFADGLNPVNAPEDIPQDIVKDFVTDVEKDTIGPNKYEQYSAFGIALSADGTVLNYNGQRVKMLVDLRSDRSFETFWVDEAGTINLSVVRNSAGKITAIENISDEKAQEYN